MKFVKRATILLITLAIIITQHRSSHAQNNKPQPIYSGVQLAYLEWSADGLTLLFTDVMSVANSIHNNDPEQWQSYDPNKELLTQSALSPLRTVMTDAQREALKPPTALRYPTITPVSYLSPNERYLVYVSEPAGNNWQLSLADLQSGRSVSINAFAFEAFLSQNLYRVLWNDTSTAFVTVTESASGLPGYIFYTSSFSQTVEDMATQPLGVPDRNGRSYMYASVYDISDDGKIVLILIGDTTTSSDPENRVRYLTLWQADNPAASTLIETINGRKVIGATFAPDDESKIWFINEVGLSEYDLQTGQIRVMDTALNSTWLTKARFSPDGRWVAVIEPFLDFGEHLYVYPTTR